MKLVSAIPTPSTISDYVAPSDILFVTESSPWGKRGFEAVAASFSSVQAVFWSHGMPKPNLNAWQGEWIISFKSDLILSKETLKSAEKGAINFHPSPPKYRGLGGYWWALHNNDDNFGVTCHHMDERIDHGSIIATDTFSILPGETVESLKHKAALHSLKLLNKSLQAILSNKPLTPCGVEWEKHLYTNQELMLAQSAAAKSLKKTQQDALIYIEKTFVALNDEFSGTAKDKRLPLAV